MSKRIISPRRANDTFGNKKIARGDRGEVLVARKRGVDRRTRKEKSQEEAERAAAREEKKEYKAPRDYAPGVTSGLMIIPGTSADVREANEHNIRSAIRIMLSGHTVRDMARLGSQLREKYYQHRTYMPFIESMIEEMISAKKKQETEENTAARATGLGARQRQIVKMLDRSVGAKIIKKALRDKYVQELSEASMPTAAAKEQWLSMRGIVPQAGGTAAFTITSDDRDEKQDTREYVRRWTAVRNHARAAGGNLVDTRIATITRDPRAMIASKQANRDYLISQAQARLDKIRVAVRWHDLLPWQKRAAMRHRRAAAAQPRREVVAIMWADSQAEAAPTAKRTRKLPPPSSGGDVVAAFAALERRDRKMERRREAREEAEAMRWARAIADLHGRDGVLILASGKRLPTHATSILSMGANGEITMSDDVPPKEAKGASGQPKKEDRKPKNKAEAKMPAAQAAAAAVAAVAEEAVALRDAVADAKAEQDKAPEEPKKLDVVQPHKTAADLGLHPVFHHDDSYRVVHTHQSLDEIKLPSYYTLGVDEFAVVMRPELEDSVDWSRLRRGEPREVISVFAFLTGVWMICRLKKLRLAHEARDSYWAAAWYWFWATCAWLLSGVHGVCNLLALCLVPFAHLRGPAYTAAVAVFGRFVAKKAVASKFVFSVKHLDTDVSTVDKRPYQMRSDDAKFGAIYCELVVRQTILWNWMFGSYTSEMVSTHMIEYGTLMSYIPPASCTTVADFRNLVNRTVLAAHNYRPVNIAAEKKPLMTKGAALFVTAVMASQLHGVRLN